MSFKGELPCLNDIKSEEVECCFFTPFFSLFGRDWLLIFNSKGHCFPSLNLFSDALEKQVERGLRLLDDAGYERLTNDDAASGTIFR